MLWKIALAATVLVILLAPRVHAGVLEEYVFQERDRFGWNLETELETEYGVNLAIMNVFSGQWQTTHWRHRLRVLIPPGADGTSAVIYVTGSGSGADDLRMFSQLAQATDQTIAILFDVPNQPLFDGLTEDALIAHSFEKFLETEDTDWPALFPMVRSVTAAMDALQAFAADRFDSSMEDFLIAGASKRGWTSWLAAAADERVKSIIPAVYDNLNLAAQMEQHLKAWGEYSPQIHDYTERSLPDLLAAGEGQQLVELVDPYAYRHRIPQPKLLLLGTNDPYWPADAAGLYVDDLEGPTYLHYVPNAGHGLRETEEMLNTMAAFIRSSLAEEMPMPDIRSSREDGRDAVTLSVETGVVADIRFWNAISSSRDFRNAHWEIQEVKSETETAAKQWQRHSDLYTAVYAEAVFKTQDGSFSLSTPIHIVTPEKS